MVFSNWNVYAQFFKFVVCNSAVLIFSILSHPCFILYLVFFYLIKLLFSGFLPFKGNFVCDKNTSKYRDWAPLKGQCHAIWQLYKNLEGVFASELNSKTNGLGLLCKTIWRYWKCFLSPVASDGKDGNGLKFEKKLPVFSNFDATSSKNPQELYYG